MKKRMKMTAAAAAFAMAAALALPMTVSMTASAVNVVITGNSTPGASQTTHTYRYYKIFSGTAIASNLGQDGADNQALGNAAWADKTCGAALLTAIQGDARFCNVENDAESNLFKSCVDAKDVADVLGSTALTSNMAKAFAECAVTAFAAKGVTPQQENGKFSIGEDGYYVIEETSTAGGTATLYLLGVVDSDAESDYEINAKSKLPSFDKQVKDGNVTKNETDAEHNGVWRESADYNIGDEVPFRLTATLPDDYADYKKYSLTFHDDLSHNAATGDEVFTLTPSSIKVYLDPDGDDGPEEQVLLETGYELKYAGGASAPTDACDLEVYIENLKTISEAKGAEGKSTIIVEYTAKLKENAAVGSKGNWNSAKLTYSNNPYYDGTPDADHTDTTKEETVVTFTYDVVVDKTDKEGNALKGAQFTLQKWNPTGNNPDSETQPNTEGAWETITKFENVEGKGAGENTFTFHGIDAGRYRLIESVTPDGYNTIEPYEFTVTATHTDGDNPALTQIDIYDKDGNLIGSSDPDAVIDTDKKAFVVGITDELDGIAKTSIKNYRGTALPSTGGIGTVMFYVIGGMLTVGAGVTLIAKKRMEKK